MKYFTLNVYDRKKWQQISKGQKSSMYNFGPSKSRHQDMMNHIKDLLEEIPVKERGVKEGESSD